MDSIEKGSEIQETKSFFPPCKLEIAWLGPWPRVGLPVWRSHHSNLRTLGVLLALMGVKSPFGNSVVLLERRHASPGGPNPRARLCFWEVLEVASLRHLWDSTHKLTNSEVCSAQDWNLLLPQPSWNLLMGLTAVLSKYSLQISFPRDKTLDFPPRCQDL